MAEGRSAGLVQLLQLPQGLAQLPHLTCKDRTGQDRVGQDRTGWDRLQLDQTGTGGTPTADAVGQVGELLGVVQHLHALGVGVVAHREGLGDGGCELPDGDPEETSIIRSPPPSPPTGLIAARRHSLPHFLFGIFEAVGNKVDGLVLRDGVLLQAGLVGVEGQDLGLVRQTILLKKTKNPEKLQAGVPSRLHSQP